MKSRAAWLLCATTCLTPMLGGHAFAQTDAPAAAPAPPADTGVVGDIVVTATRGAATSVQHVPVSVQAISPLKLEERQIQNFADYANLLPSVSFSTLGPGRSSLFFRGISSNTGLATAGTYLDDIPITTASRMPDVHVYDVERVEALSGPQGTLFGSSSLAGTLRIITNKPNTTRFEAGFDAQVDKYGKGNAGDEVEGFINVPVNEKLAVRIMGYYQHDGGYIDNKYATHTYQLGDADPNTTYTINNSAVAKDNYNPNTDFGGRIMIGFHPDENWTITPSLTMQKLISQGSFNFDPRVGDLAVHDFSPTWLKDQWAQAALSIEGHIHDFELTSTTGYFWRKYKNANDYTYYTVTYDNFGPGYESYLQFRDKNGNLINPTQQYFGEALNTKFTQELRLTVPKSWPFKLTVGGFYQRQLQHSVSQYYIPGLGQATAFGGGPSKAVYQNAFYLVSGDTTYRDYAAFGEASYNITSKLTVTGGIRWFRADNTTYGFSGVQSSAKKAGCTTFTYIFQCTNNNTRYTQDGETHKVNLSWQMTPDKMLYATYSTGFRPGGANRIAPTQPYEADTLDNYEVGFKTSWNGNIRVNGAFYYEKWNGMQYGVVPYGFQGAGLTLNAGDARVYGVELDGDWRIGDLTLSASGAYNDAALSTNFCNLTKNAAGQLVQLQNCTLPAQIAATKGTRLPRQPRFKGQASARYEWPLGAWTPYVQGVLFYQSSSTSNLDAKNNALLGNTDGFATADFSVGVRHGDFTIEAFIQNAFDNRGILSRNTFCSIEYCSGSSRAFPIKPEYFGVKVSQRY